MDGSSIEYAGYSIYFKNVNSYPISTKTKIFARNRSKIESDFTSDLAVIKYEQDDDLY